MNAECGGKPTVKKNKTTGSQKKKRKFRNRSFCILEPDLIESDAVRDLSGKFALLVLIRFHQKAHRRNPSRKKQGIQKMIITNNGEIVFTHAEARELGIKSSGTFWKVCRELVEKGFLELAEYPNWLEKKPGKWAISTRWKWYGTNRFETKSIKRILPSGVGFQKKPKNKKAFTGVNSHCLPEYTLTDDDGEPIVYLSKQGRRRRKSSKPHEIKD
jgi:hypothetical protein